MSLRMSTETLTTASSHPSRPTSPPSLHRRKPVRRRPNRRRNANAAVTNADHANRAINGADAAATEIASRRNALRATVRRETARPANVPNEVTEMIAVTAVDADEMTAATAAGVRSR